MISIAFILCSSLLLTSAFPQAIEQKEVEPQGIDVVLKNIMSNVMQDVFSGKSMPHSLARRTIEELDNQGATELANILRNALDRIKELQSGEKLDVIAVRVVNSIFNKLGEDNKDIKELHEILGKEHVDKFVGRLALIAEKYIRERFGPKAI